MRPRFRFLSLALLAVTLLALPAARASDLVLAPTDGDSAKTHAHFKSGQSVTIDGRTYKLVDLVELTAQTRKRFEHFIVARLEFDSQPLAEVLAFLESRFTNIDDGESGNYPFMNLTADPEAAKERVTIHAKNMLLKDVLKDLAKQAGCVSIEFHGSAIHLSLKPATASAPLN